MERPDQLRELFRMQKALNERIGVRTEGMSDEDKTKWLLNYCRAMSQEIAELTNVIALNASSQTRLCDVPLNALHLQTGALADIWGPEIRWSITDGTLHELRLGPRSGCVLQVVG